MNRTPSPIVGCAIGDALGVPWETATFDTPAFQTWDETYWAAANHPFMQGAVRPGQWSDDTQMTLALTASILDQDEYSPEIAAQFYQNMFEGGKGAILIAGNESASGIRGIGRATRFALEKLHNNIVWWRAGTRDAEGNGTAMRASPLGVLYRKDLKTLQEAAFLDARITHNSLVAMEASCATALVAAYLANGLSALKTLEELAERPWGSPIGAAIKTVLLPIQGLLKDRPLESLSDPGLVDWRTHYQQAFGVTGHAINTVARCLFVLGSTNSLEGAVVGAVRGGGDADTAAAIVGAWAGILYGLPDDQRYLRELEEVGRLKYYDAKLWELGE